MSEEFVCPTCMKECASAAGLAAHSRSHDASGAIIPTWHQHNGRMGVGQRTIKMLRPICPLSRSRTTEHRSCQRRGGAWWEHCVKAGHDPYVSVVQVPSKSVEYSDPDENGTRKVVKVTDEVTAGIEPNRVEVALSPRVNFGGGVRRARAKGFLLPVELRNEAYPNGIAPACQFRECFAQDGSEGIKLTEYRVGVFCRKTEAQLVGIDQDGKVLEYDHDRDPISQSIRRQMLDEVAV